MRVSQLLPFALGACVLAGPIPHGPLDHFMIPTIDATIDLFDPTNLVPSGLTTLKYADQSRNTAVTIDFHMTSPAVVLENSALIRDIKCFADVGSVSLNFKASDAAALAVIDSWPRSGLVLVTNSPACSPTDERGVYIVESTYASSTSFSFQVRSTSWKNVADTMYIKTALPGVANGGEGPRSTQDLRVMA